MLGDGRGAGGDRAAGAARRAARSTYHKVLDREAWTHAVVSAAVVLADGRATSAAARAIVLGGVAPIPWRLPEVEKLLAGQRITPELAAKAGEAAVAGARPLAKNGYKVPLTRGMVGADDPARRTRPDARLKRRATFSRCEPVSPRCCRASACTCGISTRRWTARRRSCSTTSPRDLRGVRALRLTETSWLTRADLKRSSIRCSNAFTAGGGRID